MDGGHDAASRDQVSGGHVLARRMGYYYRCRIPPLDDEDASVVSDALQIGLSSPLARILQIRAGLVLSLAATLGAATNVP